MGLYRLYIKASDPEILARLDADDMPRSKNALELRYITCLLDADDMPDLLELAADVLPNMFGRVPELMNLEEPQVYRVQDCSSGLGEMLDDSHEFLNLGILPAEALAEDEEYKTPEKILQTHKTLANNGPGAHPLREPPRRRPRAQA